jgi:hypothetical protein
MGTRLQKRHLEDLQRRLSAARESLGVLQEQVAVWNEALEDARIRSLVSETPLQTHDYHELSRHVARPTPRCSAALVKSVALWRSETNFSASGHRKMKMDKRASLPTTSRSSDSISKKS